MKGTLISILIGALAGVLLTVGSSLHASHAAANRAAPDGGIVILDPAAADAAPRPDPAAASEEPAPLAD